MEMGMMGPHLMLHHQLALVDELVRRNSLIFDLKINNSLEPVGQIEIDDRFFGAERFFQIVCDHLEGIREELPVELLVYLLRHGATLCQLFVKYIKLSRELTYNLGYQLLQNGCGRWDAQGGDIEQVASPRNTGRFGKLWIHCAVTMLNNTGPGVYDLI